MECIPSWSTLEFSSGTGCTTAVYFSDRLDGTQYCWGGCLMWGAAIQAIPLAGSVYKTLKQLLETLLKDTNGKFRRVILVEYPRHGIWAIAFVTGTISNEVPSSSPYAECFHSYHPKPTTGWYAIVPEEAGEHFNVD